jgi:hypothetical protein
MIDIQLPCRAWPARRAGGCQARVESGMYGILYKSIGKEDKRAAGPMEDVGTPF